MHYDTLTKYVLEYRIANVSQDTYTKYNTIRLQNTYRRADHQRKWAPGGFYPY